MAKPKIALVPSAQGSKFYSVLPSSGVGDFDFTRSGSATRINSQGLIETVGNGVSRLNYPLIDGKVVGCPSHILEPQSTNLITYSENFSQWYIDGNQSSPTIISELNPDGSSQVYQINLNSGGNIYRTISISSSIDYTFSVYIKGTGNGRLILSNAQSTPENYVDFTATSEWQRIELTGSSSSTSVRVAIGSWSNSSASGTIQIFGAQLEQQSYATSYIPTNGSSVTRSAETANGSGDASTFNDSEGVLMFEGGIPKDENVFRNISISDGSSNNFVTFYTTNSLNKITYLLGVGGQGAVFGLDYFFQDITIPFKIALVYSSGRNEIWVNGIKVNQNSNTFNLMSGLNQLSFDNGTGGGNWYGNTKQVQYYDSSLTDSELETLTSWVSFSDMANGQLYSVE